jgi:hypothetical protein
MQAATANELGQNIEHAALPIDDGAVRNWARLNKANKARIAKDCSEQFYTDLRWPMSAWLLQQRFDTHGKTSLGASIADLPSLRAHPRSLDS